MHVLCSNHCVFLSVCLSVCLHLTSFKVQTSDQLGQFINCPSQMLTKFIVVSTLGGLALKLHKFVSFCMPSADRMYYLEICGPRVSFSV